MEAIYPTELHEYSVYGAIFKIRIIFWSSYFGQNGVESTAYYRRHLHHVNSNRNSIRLLLLFTNLDKNSIIGIYGCLMQEGLLATYQRVYFADKANYYIGQSQYIPVYETQLMLFINWQMTKKGQLSF
jgi:hypothetical protein